MITLSSCAVSDKYSSMSLPYWQEPVSEWREICKQVAWNDPTLSHSVAMDGRDEVLFLTGNLGFVTRYFQAAIAELVG